MPERGLSILERAVDEAGFLLRAGLRSTTSSILVGESETGGELGRDDRSDRRVSEKVLSLRLCLGISSAGVATSAGPSTPVLTMVVVLAACVRGDASALAGLELSD
jgi:hypothetical protein